MPYVIFVAAPGMELLKQLYDFGRSTGVSNRSLAVRIVIMTVTKFVMF